MANSELERYRGPSEQATSYKFPVVCCGKKESAILGYINKGVGRKSRQVLLPVHMTLLKVFLE